MSTASAGSNGALSHKRSLEHTKDDFVASSTFTGTRDGFYFGTGSLGTGYYRDRATPNNKRQKKKGVSIAEDRNETRLYSTEQLLRDAELQASSTRVLDLTVKGVQTAGRALHKAMEHNALQRAQHGSDPAAYMDSEVAVYEHVRVLFGVSADSALYATVVEQELLPNTVLPLLMHENLDIVSSVISLLVEWLDATTIEDDTTIAHMGVLAAHFLQHSGADYVVDNLGRYLQQPQNEENDNEDEVGKGAEDCLALLENILEIDTLSQAAGGDGLLVPREKSVPSLFCKETHLVAWLLGRISDENGALGLKMRSLELLAILTPREEIYEDFRDWSKINPYTSSLMEEENAIQKTKDEEKPVTLDAIEILLQEIAVYRKTQPSDEQNVDMLENAGVILASLLTFSNDNILTFLEHQGVELVIRCLKERVHAGGIVLKLLDFSGSYAVHKKACEHIPGVFLSTLRVDKDSLRIGGKSLSTLRESIRDPPLPMLSNLF